MDVAEEDGEEPVARPRLRIRVARRHPWAEVHLCGSLDAHTASDVRNVLDALLKDGHDRFLLHVTELAQWDADGVATLVATERMLREAGATAQWSGLPVPRRSPP